MDSGYLPRLAAALAVAGISCLRFTCRTLHLPTRVNAIQAVLSEAASSWSETAAVPCWFCAGHSMGGRAACQVAYSNWQQQEQEQERRQKKQQAPPQVEEKEKGQGVVAAANQTRSVKKRNLAATAPGGEPALTSAARGAMEKMTKRTRGAVGTNGKLACVVHGSGSGGEEGPGGGGGGGSSGVQRLIQPEAESARDCSGAGPSAGGNAGSPRVVGCLLLSYPLHPPDKPDQLRDDPLCKLRCPLLFVRGSRDEFSQEKLFAGVMERMVSTRVQVHTVEGGDHSLKVPRGKRKLRVDDAEHVSEEAVQDRDGGVEDTDQMQEVLRAVISFVKEVAGDAWVRAKAENKLE
ncbi:hypothetical protein Vretimale_16824 [Volvox reticuliferus]|nr:hypothetical protein Vretimale_16824 [Volvox reticuliferus]